MLAPAAASSSKWSELHDCHKRQTCMTWATLYLVFFLLAALAALGGLFLFGWKRRNDKTPKVAPLPRDDDWD